MKHAVGGVVWAVEPKRADKAVWAEKAMRAVKGGAIGD